MKIILSGYGKMGREIEKIALARGHEIAGVLDTPDDWLSRTREISKSDVILDFSTPDSVVGNIRRCFDLRQPVVVGTSGWHQQEPLVRKWCDEEQQSILVASNFSVGVNILFGLTRKLAEVLSKLENYNITLEEIHHVHKLDAPSGTAISLANIIIENIGRKTQWVNHVQERSDELQIISTREGEVPGIHTIRCDSATDRLILQHEAKSREGFALGAVLAAEWLPGKSGYFGMADLLNLPR